MSEEQLAELKDAWPGEWRRDRARWQSPRSTHQWMVWPPSFHALDIDQRHTVAAFVGDDGTPVVLTEAGWRESVRSDRGAKTFTEAVATFRANAREIAAPYLAICGDAP